MVSQLKDIEKISGANKYVRSVEKQHKPLTIYINPTRLRICINTARNLEWNEKTRVAMFELAGDWYIAKTNESDGYKVSKHGRGGFSFTAAIVLRRVFNKVTKSDCVLTKTQYEYHGSPVYKIEKRLS